MRAPSLAHVNSSSRCRRQNPLNLDGGPFAVAWGGDTPRVEFRYDLAEARRAACLNLGDGGEQFGAERLGAVRVNLAALGCNLREPLRRADASRREVAARAMNPSKSYCPIIRRRTGERQIPTACIATLRPDLAGASSFEDCRNRFEQYREVQ